jgi:hypothetical protein
MTHRNKTRTSLLEGGRKLGESVNKDVRHEDFTAVSVKIASFWDVTPCSLISANVYDEPTVFVLTVERMSPSTLKMEAQGFA